MTHVEIRSAATVRKFLVTLQPGEDGWIVAECPALPGCMSQGRTKSEALTNVGEAIQGWLETQAEVGGPAELEVAEVLVEVPGR